MKQSLQICIARFLSVAILSKSYCLASPSEGICLDYSGGLGGTAGGQEPDEQLTFVGLDTTRRGLGAG